MAAFIFDRFRESMPVQWEDFSQAHLRHAAHEQEGSMRLRGLIASTLSQTSQDMREQADRVEEALNQRVAETEEATRGLEDNLKQVQTLIHVTRLNVLYYFHA